MSMGRRN